MHLMEINLDVVCLITNDCQYQKCTFLWLGVQILHDTCLRRCFFLTSEQPHNLIPFVCAVKPSLHMFALPGRLHKSYLEEKAGSLGPFILILLSLRANTRGAFPSHTSQRAQRAHRAASAFHFPRRRQHRRPHIRDECGGRGRWRLPPQCVLCNKLGCKSGIYSDHSPCPLGTWDHLCLWVFISC